MADTIFAQATAKGRAGVAVIRISGLDAFPAIDALCGRCPPERRAELRSIRAPSGEVIDRGLVLCFPGPRSFTGEDVAELHIHGGTAVSAAVLALLARRPGSRLAEPGEFTRRALMHGRLDLAQVEGLGDLLSAETEAQRRQATALMSGTLSAQAARWRAGLIRALAFIEASIDFVDDAVPDNVLDAMVADLGVLEADLRATLAGARIAERVREGFEVALVGAPNVGKSTLLNVLAKREAAITSAIAGTTRDVIEVRMDLDGLAVTMLDMAGLRDTQDTVERIGVERARARAAAADVRLFMVEEPASADGLGVELQVGDIVVRAKGDLAPGAREFSVSGLTGAGVPRLLSELGRVLGARVAQGSGVSHARQAGAIARAADALHAARQTIQEDRPEIAAEELRLAVRALDFLVGKVDVEAVLDMVFQSFCLGK